MRHVSENHQTQNFTQIRLRILEIQTFELYDKFCITVIFKNRISQQPFGQYGCVRCHDDGNWPRNHFLEIVLGLSNVLE